MMKTNYIFVPLTNFHFVAVTKIAMVKTNYIFVPLINFAPLLPKQSVAMVKNNYLCSTDKFSLCFHN